VTRKHLKQAEPASWRQARQLLDLAQDVSRYLRHHTSAAVRLSAALLLAASLAACNASATDTTMVQTRAVAPLTQEVVSGLPRGPGNYPVVRGSVFRDQRGVYQFEWLDPGTATGPGHVAHASRLRLVDDNQLLLEMPESGDPILHLPADEDVGLIQQAQVGATQPGPGFYPSPYSYWHPFSPGLVVVGRPAYYDPPRTIVVDDASGGGTGSSGSSSRPALRVEGGTVSETARPPAARVTGVQSAVSGRAGGTGSGSAVTSRNLSSGAARDAAGVSSGSASSSSARVGRATSGTSGSSGVSAPRSGGFSAGSGSSGGSAAS
jgi:hypothetical protein